MEWGHDGPNKVSPVKRLARGKIAIERMYPDKLECAFELAIQGVEWSFSEASRTVKVSEMSPVCVRSPRAPNRLDGT